jgi:hypothetical protein
MIYSVGSVVVIAKILPAGNDFWQNITKMYETAGSNGVFGEDNVQIEDAKQA